MMHLYKNITIDLKKIWPRFEAKAELTRTIFLSFSCSPKGARRLFYTAKLTSQPINNGCRMWYAAFQIENVHLGSRVQCTSSEGTTRPWRGCAVSLAHPFWKLRSLNRRAWYTDLKKQLFQETKFTTTPVHDDGNWAGLSPRRSDHSILFPNSWTAVDSHRPSRSVFVA